MATKKAEPILDERVSNAWALREKIAALEGELAGLETEILARGSGRYRDDQGHVCTAVDALLSSTGPHSYALRDDEEDKARQLAGESFAELFDRKVVYSPKEGFEHRVNALLTPAKERDLLALCYVAGKVSSGKKAYIRW